MKKIAFTGIITTILVIIIVMAVVIQKQRTAVAKALNLTLSDNTPTADTPGPANEIEALRILSPENHMPDIYDRFEHHPERIKFYQRQLKAIEYIGDNGIKAAIPQLILYLDYPTSGVKAVLDDPAHGGWQEIARAKKVWPAFNALLEIPGSGDALRDYCLNPVHPMRYRLTTFEILQYIDPELVESCWPALKAEGQETEFRRLYDMIKSGHLHFWGMRGSVDSQ